MHTKPIVMDPRILSGKPIFKGTRIPVYLVLELLETGHTPETIIHEHYPQLSLTDVKHAIHYAASLTKREPLQLIEAA